MSEPESYSERTRFYLRDTFILDGGDQSDFKAGAQDPIHFGGAAVLLSNNSPTLDARISLQDSADGATWSILFFSTAWAANQLSYTMVSLSQVQILFVTVQRYVRFTVTPTNPDGVLGIIHQWVPRAAPVGAAEY